MDVGRVVAAVVHRQPDRPLQLAVALRQHYKTVSFNAFSLKLEGVHDAQSAVTLSANRWYYVAATCDGQQLKLWLADLTASMLRHGTVSRTSRQIAEEGERLVLESETDRDRALEQVVEDRHEGQRAGAPQQPGAVGRRGHAGHRERDAAHAGGFPAAANSRL